MSNNARKLTAELAFELGYQRALDDLDTYYCQVYKLAADALDHFAKATLVAEAFNVASDAIDYVKNDEGENTFHRYEDELRKLDQQYKHARNMIAQLDTGEENND